ncbi:hypothetical protein [Aurantiacibacter sp. D1-12]|uniref:hypothetical protein n=1 Tax=Aurantiacibacter sp. D1-12 TaxID=2993658 RepID=UPI00237CC719|nr:hypothetical protein [Aurantiacibacter sp. D1-12]MDE1467680.1 hypothetical protein [Aurantiacibacter sp. D1-12]
MRVDNVGSLPPIDIEEFSRIVSERYVQGDPETIWALREPLAALAQNTNLMFSKMLESLEARNGKALVTDQPTYHMLHRTKGWSLRLTIWMPESANKDVRILENNVFAYDYPHDHNFDLLTTNVAGVGYETDVLEHGGIDPGSDVGDIVDATPLGRKRLSPGTVFLYEGCKDVHSQVPVDSITLALNFIPYSPANSARSQYSYRITDEEKLEILGSPLSYEQREMGLVRLLGKLAAAGHHGVSGPLQTLAGQSRNPRVRDYATHLKHLVATRDDTMHEDLREQIDRNHLAVKYNRVAAMRREALGVD